MTKLKIKKIEQELETKETLEDKKKFLEKLLERAKGKIKEKIENLLKNINEQIIQREEEELEKKIKITKVQVIEEEPAKAPEPPKYTTPERTYVPRIATEEGSGLERELAAERPIVEERVVFRGPEQKEFFRRDVTYALQDTTGRKVLDTLVFYLKREGLEPTRAGISSEEQQTIVSRVTEYFRGMVPESQVQNYLTSLQRTGLPEKEVKYKFPMRG